MRNFERTVLVNTLCFALGAGGLILACSSSNTDTPTDDGGVPLDEAGMPILDGATGDSSTGDSSVPPTKCKKATDCPSGVCNQATGLCAAASCKDGAKNGSESDTDCGGDCSKCDMGKACKLAADCTSGVCKDTGTGLKCQAPACDDLAKNADETDVDCGGLNCAKCADGKTCKVRSDCLGDVCNSAKKCITPTCNDGIITPPKTDIDCGGPNCPRCIDGRKCLVAGDCTSGVCADVGAGPQCQPPSFTDGVKNGAETDVDCGSDPAYPCATGKNCKVGGDCTSLGCDYNFKCAAGRSCTQHYGGDTCGTGGPGGLGGQNWESCCTTLPVTTASGGTVYMDKYPVTSGRMRAFLEDADVQYNVRAAIQALRVAGKIPVIPINASNAIDGVHPVLDPSWDPFLPTGFGATAAGEISDCNQSNSCTVRAGGACTCSTDATRNANGECDASVICTPGTEQPGIYTAVRNHLGGNIFKNNSQPTTGCFVGGPGVHSYRFKGAADGQPQDGANPEQPIEVYDTKTLNCVDNLMAQAFCVWDGGRLETYQEWQAASGFPATPWSAGGDTRTAVSIGSASYFGCRFPTATDADQHACMFKWGPARGGADPFAGDNRSNQLADYQYSYEYPNLGSGDYIVHLTAPGRTTGRGPLGHADLFGAGFEQTSNVTWSAWNPAVPNSGPFAGRHRWSANGSWEVHGYGQQVSSDLLNKYGKLGARCVKFAPN